jgi:restriction endonuclease Mrr
VLSGIDARPNQLDLSGTEFEHFVHNLFTKMGCQVQMFKAGGDGGVDCVTYDPNPVFGGKFCVQAKRYKGTVPPSALRDLYGAVQHEGATKGLLITTIGFSKATYAWANNKPAPPHHRHRAARNVPAVRHLGPHPAARVGVAVVTARPRRGRTVPILRPPRR